MTQIDGRSSTMTKSRWRTLGAAGIRKAHRVSNFPRMMARRLAGEGRTSQSGQRRRRLACQDGPRAGPKVWAPIVDPLMMFGEFPCDPPGGGVKKDGRGRWWWDHEGG